MIDDRTPFRQLFRATVLSKLGFSTMNISVDHVGIHVSCMNGTFDTKGVEEIIDLLAHALIIHESCQQSLKE